MRLRLYTSLQAEIAIRWYDLPARMGNMLTFSLTAAGRWMWGSDRLKE